MKAKWLLDQYMVEHNEQNLPELLRKEGFEVKVGQYDRFASNPPFLFSPEDCVIVYGSMEFVRLYQKAPYIPGVYFQEKAMECTTYISNIEKTGLLLNENHVFATFGELIRRKDFFYNAFETNQLFIRPNSGRKVFTGFSLNKKEFDKEISALSQLTSVMPETLILIAPSQEILEEYRLIIVNRQVITGSQYQRNGNIELSSKIPQEVEEMAYQIANTPWQPDIAYVCDIALTHKGPRVIELNAMSTSGLYLSDISKWSHALNQAAISEYHGDLTLGDLAPPQDIIVSKTSPKMHY